MRLQFRPHLDNTDLCLPLFLCCSALALCDGRFMLDAGKRVIEENLEKFDEWVLNVYDLKRWELKY